MEEEKSLEEFFKGSTKEYKTKKTRNVSKSSPPKVRENDSKGENFFVRFFKKRFSFDEDVDLTNPTNVLYRRNYVIKNITILANLVFVLFSLVGISKSNIIITIAFWLIMTALSQTIHQMIKRKTDDASHQQLIMYLQSLFIFILSITLYIRVYLGFTVLDSENPGLTNVEFSITQASYILIYLTFVIMSLYQDTKLLRAMFFWILVVMTVIHLTLLHPELYSHASSFLELWDFIKDGNYRVFLDIGLRTFVFLVFYASLYSAASVFHFVSEERKTEFKRRVGVEASFKDVVESVFEAVKAYDTSQDTYSLRLASIKVSAVSRELALAMNLQTAAIMEVDYSATVHAEKLSELNLLGFQEINQENFDSVLEKTKLATTIIKRLQLTKNAEDIVYRYFQGTLDKRFVDKMSLSPNDYVSNIILLSEIYSILRSDASYKKALTHQRAVEIIENGLCAFFDHNLIVRFVKFNHEIQIAYDRA